jgi:predicted nucleotidyltransferase
MDAQASSTLLKLRDTLQSIYGPRLSHMILYGSHARGEAARDSDIDVLVVLKGPVQAGAEIARTSDAVAALSLHTDNVISCLFIDEERYLHRAGPLLRNIRREGVALL